jgi:hypothetical protein
MSCECPICYEVIGDTNSTTTSCGHKFHTECILKSIMIVNNLCPYCRAPLMQLTQPISLPLPTTMPQTNVTRQLDIETLNANLRTQLAQEHIQQMSDPVLIYLSALSSDNLCRLRFQIRRHLREQSH